MPVGRQRGNAPARRALQKTLLNVEGLGKQLYPELDLWKTALPFLEEWQRQRLSPLNNLRKIREKLPEWIEQAPEVPELVLQALERAGTTSNEVNRLAGQITTLQQQLQTARKLGQWALAAGLLGLLLALCWLL